MTEHVERPDELHEPLSEEELEGGVRPHSENEAMREAYLDVLGATKKQVDAYREELGELWEKHDYHRYRHRSDALRKVIDHVEEITQSDEVPAESHGIPEEKKLKDSIEALMRVDGERMEQINAAEEAQRKWAYQPKSTETQELDVSAQKEKTEAIDAAIRKFREQGSRLQVEVSQISNLLKSIEKQGRKEAALQKIEDIRGLIDGKDGVARRYVLLDGELELAVPEDILATEAQAKGLGELIALSIDDLRRRCFEYELGVIVVRAQRLLQSIGQAARPLAQNVWDTLQKEERILQREISERIGSISHLKGVVGSSEAKKRLDALLREIAERLHTEKPKATLSAVRDMHRNLKAEYAAVQHTLTEDQRRDMRAHLARFSAAVRQAEEEAWHHHIGSRQNPQETLPPPEPPVPSGVHADVRLAMAQAVIHAPTIARDALPTVWDALESR